ncbi:MAG: hypothetical protein K0V04_12420 [Deltaproteobacteria bacterium]|nr:hypothetical protein [Deltaproteobacteria bacterium]
MPLLAPAGPGGVRVDWHAPPQCPDAQWVRREVAAHLGGGSTEPPSLDARADVTNPANGRWELDLELRQGKEVVGQRQLSAPTCSELASAAALIVAIAVDPNVAIGGGDPGEVTPPRIDEPSVLVPQEPTTDPVPEIDEVKPDPVPEESGPVVDEIAEPPLVPEAPRSPRRLSLGLGVRGGLDVGAMGVGASLRLSPALVWPRLRVELLGAWAIPRRVAADEISGVEARLQRGSAGVAVCPVLSAQAVEIPLCGAVEAGAVEGVGRGSVRGSRAVDPWVGLAVRPRLSWWPRPWVGLELEAAVVANLVRPVFETAQGRRIYRMGVIGAEFGGGLTFRLPVRPRSSPRISGTVDNKESRGPVNWRDQRERRAMQ